MTRRYFPVPYDAMAVAGPGAEQLVVYLYQTGHAARWLPFPLTGRQAEAMCHLRRQHVKLVMARLHAAGLVVVSDSTVEVLDPNDGTHDHWQTTTNADARRDAEPDAPRDAPPEPPREPAMLKKKPATPDAIRGLPDGRNHTRTHDGTRGRTHDGTHDGTHNQGSTPPLPDAPPHARVEVDPRVTDRPTDQPTEVGQEQEGPPDGAAGVVPDWARKAKAGIPPLAATAAVVRALEAITRRIVYPERCSTSAKQVLSLWMAAGRPPLELFCADLALVGEWGHDSPDRMASHDLRGVGWTDGKGVDRSGSVDTVCRHHRWDERLSSARSWADRGKPRVGSPRLAPPVPPKLADAPEMDAIGTLLAAGATEAELLDLGYNARETG